MSVIPAFLSSDAGELRVQDQSILHRKTISKINQTNKAVPTVFSIPSRVGI
jgi:hypothetical protein